VDSLEDNASEGRPSKPNVHEWPTCIDRLEHFVGRYRGGDRRRHLCGRFAQYFGEKKASQGYIAMGAILGRLQEKRLFRFRSVPTNGAQQCLP
jgi:hypothetical protein